MPSITVAGVAAGASAIGTAATVGTDIAGAVNSGSAATQAANTQAASANEAAALQGQIYVNNNNNLAPFRNVGQSANYSLADLYGLDRAGGGNTGAGIDTTTPAGGALSQLMALSGYGPNGQPNSGAIPAALQQFTNSPTYKFAQQQGEAALDASAASKGTLLSGAQNMASQQFGQGLASQQLGTYTTNLQNLYSGLVSGLNNLGNSGQNSAATTGQQGLASAGQIGQSLGQAGTATASGILGAANATNTGLGNSLAALTGSNSSYGGTGGALGQLANLALGNSSSGGSWDNLTQGGGSVTSGGGGGGGFSDDTVQS